MAKILTSLDWHIVSGEMEVEELMISGEIKPYKAKHRHDLFLKIKYPEHRFYQGGWGPELLHLVNEGPYRGTVGKVWCTYERYRDISNWFLAAMFRQK